MVSLQGFLVIKAVLFPAIYFRLLETNMPKNSRQTLQNFSNSSSFELIVILDNSFIRTFLNLLSEKTLYFLQFTIFGSVSLQ